MPISFRDLAYFSMPSADQEHTSAPSGVLSLLKSVNGGGLTFLVPAFYKQGSIVRMADTHMCKSRRIEAITSVLGAIE